MANANNTARKPAAAKAPALPAFDNGPAWLAMIAALPAVAAARAGKYGDGKGLVPGASDMLATTPYGASMAASGTKKNGKPNAQAATCRAVALAMADNGDKPVCKAAVVYYMLTAAAVLQLLHKCKAADGNGKGGVKYIGKTQVPCPRWCADYVNGNVREDMLAKA